MRCGSAAPVGGYKENDWPSCHLQGRPKCRCVTHSITSSARASSMGGTVRPSALAVLRLITSSNVTGAWTGSSLGFAPLRMRSAYDFSEETGTIDGRDTVASSQQSNLRAMADRDGKGHQDTDPPHAVGLLLQ